MTQQAAVYLQSGAVQIELPGPDEYVLPGVRWGSVDEFPSPAYWMYQVLARRVCGERLRHRLGETLAEELSACLLGGHGIPARIGVAAFRKLKSKGLLSGTPGEQSVYLELSSPIEVEGRPLKYRFARQKARYLTAALSRLATSPPLPASGRALRDSLLNFPGIGPKTASWVARNWLDADDVAIIDIHIMRAGILGGFLEGSLNVTRDYMTLERQFLAFSRAIGVRASELDAVIWFEMMASPTTVRALLPAPLLGRTRAQKRRTHAGEPHLLD